MCWTSPSCGSWRCGSAASSGTVTTEQLDGWLYDAHHSGVYAMQRFARTLQQDLGAVRNALTEPPCSDRPPPRLGEHTEAVVAALPQAGSGG
jgi:hypothetical protein